MFRSSNMIKRTITTYATRSDFCRVFRDDMNGLYLLSLLLAGDRDLAEQCFVGGLRMSGESNPVFKEWAASWARRTIILNAIRMIRPRRADPARPSASINGAVHDVIRRPEFADIVALPAFERFVFVMSVLECYSDHECTLLLGCTRREVMEARERALRRTGEAAELRSKVIGIALEPTSMQEERDASLQIFSVLATCA